MKQADGDAHRNKRDDRPSPGARPLPARHSPRVPTPRPVRPPLPRIEFDQLNQLDDRTLASVLKATDANVLALALAGSREELIDRICAQMPARTARAFRRELHRLGPTRLSDVEAAQRVVAEVAAQLLAQRRQRVTTAIR
jgi:CelD/BcsL family acetyltransferase involved in cellulose biosynthesis